MWSPDGSKWHVGLLEESQGPFSGTWHGQITEWSGRLPGQVRCSPCSTLRDSGLLSSDLPACDVGDSHPPMSVPLFDTKLRTLRHQRQWCLLSLSQNLRALHKIRSNLRVVKGFLNYVSDALTSPEFVLPHNHRGVMLTHTHESPCAGHKGVKATHNALKQVAKWLHIQKDVVISGLKSTSQSSLTKEGHNSSLVKPSNWLDGNLYTDRGEATNI